MTRRHFLTTTAACLLGAFAPRAFAAPAIKNSQLFRVEQIGDKWVRWFPLANLRIDYTAPLQKLMSTLREVHTSGKRHWLPGYSVNYSSHNKPYPLMRLEHWEQFPDKYEVCVVSHVFDSMGRSMEITNMQLGSWPERIHNPGNRIIGNRVFLDLKDVQ